jgi:hypothetical protein
VLNSLTKLECLVCQIELFDFDNSNSAVSFIKFQNCLFTPPLGDMKRLSPAGLDFGAGPSYAVGTSSTGVAHDDDVPDWGLDLDTTADVLL